MASPQAAGRGGGLQQWGWIYYISSRGCSTSGGSQTRRLRGS